MYDRATAIRAVDPVPGVALFCMARFLPEDFAQCADGTAG